MNKLHFFTLLLLTVVCQAAEDHQQKLKSENDSKSSSSDGRVTVTNNNKGGASGSYQQNKRGVNDYDYQLQGALPSTAYVSTNSLNGFAPITATSPYAATSAHLGSYYAAPQFGYSKAAAAAVLPITSGYKFYQPSSVYPAASNTVPRLGYAHYAYPQLAYSPYYSGQHANLVAAPNAQHPAYLAGASNFYSSLAAAAHGYQNFLSAQPAVGYLQAASSPQQVQAVYSTASPKVNAGYGAAIYTASDAGHIYHQPQYAYSFAQPSAAVQVAAVQAKQLNLSPTAEASTLTATAKPISISNSHTNSETGSASSTTTTHHGNGGGALSYSSFSHHSTPLAAGYKTIAGPVFATAAPVLATAAAPVYPQHQYAVVSGSYKVAGAGGGVSPTQSAAVYAPLSVYPAGPIHYGSHLYQPGQGFDSNNYGCV